MFQTIQSWLPQVLATIKKDIKTEHLSSNPPFYRTYFGNRPINRLTSEEIYAAYEKELVSGNSDLGEWVVNRWVFKHGDLYEYFAQKLSEINPEFSEIKSLTEEESGRVLGGVEGKFNLASVYLFSVLNGVVFPKTVLEQLEKKARAEEEELKVEAAKRLEEQGYVAKIEQLEREVARFESRLSGVQKKYTTDVEALKKQIRALQKK